MPNGKESLNRRRIIGIAQRIFGQTLSNKLECILIKRTIRPVQPIREDTRKASRGWKWRMMFGLAMIGLSLWGIALCQQLFRTYIVGPRPTPLDTSFAKLAGWVAWIVFFGPIWAAGLIILSSALGRLGALDRLRAFREKWIAQEIASGAKLQDSRTFRSEEALHDGLESLSDEKVARLTKRAHQTAMLLGLFAGAFLVLLGVFGLMLAKVSVLRLTIDFAILSGISILAGLAILQRTLRKKNNAWLLPLKLFTLRVLRLHSLSADSHKTRRSGHVR